MSKYISLVKYTAKGIENIKESPNRLDAFKQLCESMGAKVEGFYLTMGRYDMVVIVDAPNPETVAKIILATAAKGAVSTETLPAFAEEEYRKTVITAFEEVENALLNLASRKEQRRELEQQIKELQTVNAAINAQLREGIVSQLEVFESERSLLTARQALLQADHDILRDTVILYKALGGGWPRETVQLAGY